MCESNQGYLAYSIVRVQHRVVHNPRCMYSVFHWPIPGVGWDGKSLVLYELAHGADQLAPYHGECVASCFAHLRTNVTD